MMTRLKLVCMVLGPQYKGFKMSIQTWENIPNFVDLISMLIIEEKNLNEESSTSAKAVSGEQIMYSNTGRGRGAEVVAEVKVEVVQVFNNNRITTWIKVQVVEDSQEAGGVLEDVVEVQIHNRIVGIVESLGICRPNVTKDRMI